MSTGQVLQTHKVSDRAYKKQCGCLVKIPTCQTGTWNKLKLLCQKRSLVSSKHSLSHKALQGIGVFTKSQWYELSFSSTGLLQTTCVRNPGLDYWYAVFTESMYMCTTTSVSGNGFTCYNMYNGKERGLCLNGGNGEQNVCHNCHDNSKQIFS